jgi:hypothetical protein
MGTGTERTSILQEVSHAFRENGLTAAITALVGGCLAVVATATRKAFTNEAMLERIDKQRAEDRKAYADRLDYIETCPALPAPASYVMQP